MTSSHSFSFYHNQAMSSGVLYGAGGAIYYGFQGGSYHGGCWGVTAFCWWATTRGFCYEIGVTGFDWTIGQLEGGG